MKKLLILRHAKSSWKDETLADHDRPLNARGRDAAPRMGRLLRQEEIVPDHIISSTARRAHDTVDLVVESSGYGGNVAWASSLYMGGHGAYLDTLRTVNAQINTLLIVGHNPDLELLVTALTGVVEILPTGALVEIELPIVQWHELRVPGDYRLVNIWRPRELSA